MRNVSFWEKMSTGLVVMSILVLALGLAKAAFGMEVMPPTAAEWGAFIEAIGGYQTLGTLGLVALVVQGLMLVARSTLGEMAGPFKFLVVSLLTLIGGVLALNLSGMDWVSALTHSTTIAAAQVFIHQAVKQFREIA